MAAKKSEAEKLEGGDENEKLSALDLPAAAAVPLDVRDIPLGDIELLANIRPQHHGIEGLAETMHADGQLQPCVVRPTPAGAAHSQPFELVFGYRRHLAAQSLGWDTVRCEVREVADDRKRRQLIIENFQREELSPVAAARAMYELKYSADPPLSNAEVARQLGVDPSQVSHQLTMLIKLAPTRPAGAEPLPHERPERAAPAADDSGEGESTPGLPRPQHNTPLGSGLALPGDVAAADDADDGEGAESKSSGLDILALVDDGKISASTAEVIASMESREEQEKLTKLVLRNDWGVKKTAEWARGVKRNDIDSATDSADEMGPLMMLDMVDVTPLQMLRLRPDLSDQEVERLVLYMQLRNGMDREMLDYVSEHLQYSYETLWDYISLLNDEEVAALKRSLALRYVTSAHRFFALEPSLRDSLGLPEDAPEDAEQAALSLPGLDDSPGLADSEHLLALGPDQDD